MKSMKMSKAESKTMLGEAPSKGPEYPYGLRLSMDEETMAKLGMGECKVGDKMPMVAMAQVMSVSEHQGEGDKEKRRHVEMQITDMEMGQAEGAAPASKMYGGKKH